MTELVLLTLAVAVAVTAPAAITGRRWSSRSPTLALWAWQSCTATVVLAGCLGAMSALLHPDQAQTLVGSAWRVCLDAVQGAHGVTGQVGAGIGLLLLAVVAARLPTSWWIVRRSTGRQRARQRAILRAFGRHDAHLRATVVAHGRPAAFMLPGRPAEIVVTTAALDRLNPGELNAVLAHERAHADGRHSLLRNTAHVLHRAFPRIPTFAQAAREIARLVEMCADDVAVRRHRRIDLARALVAMAVPDPVATTLYAAGGNVTERLYRLLTPPDPLPTAIRATVGVALILLPLTPLAIAVT